MYKNCNGFVVVKELDIVQNNVKTNILVFIISYAQIYDSD
jgi:hypothetical protein